MPITSRSGPPRDDAPARRRPPRLSERARSSMCSCAIRCTRAAHPRARVTARQRVVFGGASSYLGGDDPPVHLHRPRELADPVGLRAGGLGGGVPAWNVPLPALPEGGGTARGRAGVDSRAVLCGERA